MSDKDFAEYDKNLRPLLADCEKAEAALVEARKKADEAHAHLYKEIARYHA